MIFLPKIQVTKMAIGRNAQSKKRRTRTNRGVVRCTYHFAKQSNLHAFLTSWCPTSSFRIFLFAPFVRPREDIDPWTRRREDAILAS